MFTGSIVALVTPMLEDGSIDEKALAELIEWHIQAKTNAISVSGTTGEAPTLDTDEQMRLISLTKKLARGRLPILAGTGSCSTKTTLQLVKNAQEAGADGCLIITPYCNRPTQQGLYEHYRMISTQTSVPVILYNVPTRTACDLLPETVERIAQLKNIIGIKEATGDIERVQNIKKRCGNEFLLLSGDDATALDFILAGGHGVISVTANVAPEKMAALCREALYGNHALAEEINAQLMPLHKKLFLEANPIPVKWALSEMKKIGKYIRLPLLPLAPQYHSEVKTALQHAGVL